MPLQIRCPDCGTSYNLADTLGGKNVRCKKCQGVMKVSVPLSAGGSSQPSRTEYQTLKRPTGPQGTDAEIANTGTPGCQTLASERKLPLWCILVPGGLLLGAMVLVGGVAVWLLVFGARDHSSDDRESHRETPVVPWSVVPDPGPTFQMPAKASVSIPIQRGLGKVAFPSTPSPFVATWPRGEKNRDALVVFDLRSGARVGAALALPPKVYGPVLHPDGTMLACSMSLAPPRIVAAYSTKTGQQLTRIQEQEKTRGLLGLVDFAAEGQLLTYFGEQGQDPKFETWDIATGARKAGFAAKVDLDHVALSPGRRYLAAFSPKKDLVRVFDLKSATLAGELTMPGPDPANILRGQAFSPDGRLLAAIFIPPNLGYPSRIVTWSLVTGQLVSDHPIATSPLNLAGTSARYGDQAIQWLPDSSGWMACGHVLIDAAKGQQYLTLPPVAAVQGDDDAKRRILSGTHLAYVKTDQNFHWELVVEPLPVGN